MKAVSVLLCLTLAHGITASIFTPRASQIDDLDVLQQEYVDQYQRQHRNTPSSNEKQRNQQTNQLVQQREQLQQQQRYQQRDQEQQQQRYQQTQQQRNQPKLQSQQWEQTQQTQQKQSLDSQEYQQPAYQQVQFQSAQSSQEYKEQYPIHHHSHHNHKHHHHHQHQLESASHESSQSSQESQERRNYYDNKNERVKQSSEESQNRRNYYDNKNERVKNQHWNLAGQDSAENQKPTDAIVWKSFQMAVVPKTVAVQDQEDIEKIFGDAQRAMKPITEEDQIKFHQQYQLAKQQNNEEDVLNATQLAQKHDYPVEEHTIKTDDGYVLTLFRIPPKKQIRDVQKRPVVFLMHGIDGSADDWMLMGPGKSLAYLLSDAGYDVWLGNARGNKYSRQHVSKNPAVSDFWQYSTDDIALHDLPAMIDYALETTKQEKLYYIGHSQGTTTFFALAATRPEYNDKIIMMHALSPMAYMTNVRSPLFRMIAPTSKFHQVLEQQIGNGAFSPKKDLIRVIGGAMLEKATGCKTVSSNVNFVMAGVNYEGLDAELIPVMMKHLPAGISTKVIKQYGQGVASQDFRRYDYGPKINEKVYGTVQPPKYEMQKVQAPVTLYYSEEDWLAHPKDVERLAKELPNVSEANKIPDEHFSNMDFQFSTKAPEMVYRQLIESMENQQ